MNHDDAHPSLRPLLSALGHWELCPAPGAWPGLLVRICDQSRENDGQRGSRFLMTLLKVKFTQTQEGLDIGNGRNQNNPAQTAVSAAIITIPAGWAGQF